ncbi:hypothetical protein ScPMuIL_008813 [Solemya velum]
MDKYDLFISCKMGDLSRVQYLVEQKELDLNIRDKWDSTPLYYACLCGHLDLVKYMLDSGAKCEANTFDGERCLYGALSDEIRHLLRKYKVVSSRTLRRDLYEEFLRRLLERGMYEDVIFHIHGSVFPAHRCILSARCSVFAELFRKRWKGRKDIHLTHPLILTSAFQALLQYLYTGVMEVKIDNIPDIIRLAKHCRLPNLVDLVEDKLGQLKYFMATKPGYHITTLVVEQPIHLRELQFQLGSLADLALPPELCTFVHGELPFDPEFAPIYADICFSVQQHRFLCHKVFFCGRSDYFKALLIDYFGETDITEDNIQVVTLNGISVDTFSQVMYYLYQDSCELTEENMYEVLWAAEMYFLQGLKRQCASIISRYTKAKNVISILQLARMFSLPRLEDHCVEFIANHLDMVVSREDFCSLVQEDAKNVQKREETDSIAIIDDVRIHITSFMQTFSDMEDANEKLRMIDNLLEDLNLDG